MTLARMPASASAPPITSSSIWSEPVCLSAVLSAAARAIGAGDFAGFAVGCAAAATGAGDGCSVGAAGGVEAAGQRPATAGCCALASGEGFAACGVGAGPACAGVFTAAMLCGV